MDNNILVKGRMKDNITVAFIIVLVALCGYGLVHLFTLGDKEEDYSIICIGGHEYYRANFMNKGFLGIRLNYDGKPIKCDNRLSKHPILN